MISVNEDNIRLQTDELDALAAIYPNDWELADADGRVYSIIVKSSCAANSLLDVTLRFKLPSSYPKSSPPTVEISSPYLDRQGKDSLLSELQEIYASNLGECLLYQSIEKTREFLDKRDVQAQPVTNCSVSDSPLKSDSVQVPVTEMFLPPIHSGPTITDRKSTFQAHVASVATKDQVTLVLKKLRENRKIDAATHNIYAYRINHRRDAFLQDFEDDGEHQAGSRLLHLLEAADATNVLVVVTRWYGGIHLGTDRFRHINAVARELLQQHGFIRSKQSADGSAGKKGK